MIRFVCSALSLSLSLTRSPTTHNRCKIYHKHMSIARTNSNRYSRTNTHAHKHPIHRMLTDGTSERTPDRSVGSANIWNDTHKRRSAFIFRWLDVFGTIFRTSQIRKRSHVLWLLCRCLVLISQFSSIFHTLTGLSDLWNVETMHQILFGFLDIFGIRQPFDDFNRCWPPTHRYHRRLVTNVKSTTGGKASALIGTTRLCVYMIFQCVSCIFRYFPQR